MWSEKEVEILKKNYRSSSWKRLRRLLPKRTKGAISSKAVRLDIHHCPFCGSTSNDLPKHIKNCEKNPMSDEYIPEYAKERVNKILANKSVRDAIRSLVLEGGAAYRNIVSLIKNLAIVGHRPKLGDQFLKICGIKDWNEYDRIHKRVRARMNTAIRKESGFNKSLKKRIKKKYNNTCALCNEKKGLQVHHIDGRITNNKEINLIPLCKNHHNIFTSRKCVICERHLRTIKVDATLLKLIKDIDDSLYQKSQKYDSLYAYACPDHFFQSLKIFIGYSLEYSLLKRISSQINKQGSSEAQEEVKRVLDYIRSIKNCKYRKTPFEFGGTHCFLGFHDPQEEFKEYCEFCKYKKNLATENLLFMKCPYFEQDYWDLTRCTHPNEGSKNGCIYESNPNPEKNPSCEYFETNLRNIFS